MLTDRQMQIARHVRLGYSNDEIARTLGIKKITVKQQLSNIYKKLNITVGKPGASRALLAVWYVENNRPCE